VAKIWAEVETTTSYIDPREECPMLGALLARKAVEDAYAALGRGDPSVALAAFRTDGRLHFAGSHSWTIDTVEPDERRRWFERFAALRPQLKVRDVLVAGPPWRMRACIVFDDEIRGADGKVVYRNHGVQYAGLRWGRITFDEVNLDTQKVALLDGQVPPAARRT
jgi:ketosteroid isomerase-like protein